MEKDTLFWKVANGEKPVPDATALLGWKFILYEPKQKLVQVMFRARQSMTPPLGYIQGGLLTAMLDDCMAPAVLATLGDGHLAVTAKIETQFIKPALPGPIFSHGRVTGRNKTYRYTRGVLLDEDDNILATAKATYKVIDKPQDFVWPPLSET